MLKEKEKMIVKEVFKGFDNGGKSVMKAVLGDCSEGVIKYAGGGDVASVNGVELEPLSLAKAYDSYHSGSDTVKGARMFLDTITRDTAMPKMEL